MNTTIVKSSKEVKTCCKCKEDIYTFEWAVKLNHGKVKHLQCPCSPSDNRWFIRVFVIVVIMGSLFLSK